MEYHLFVRDCFFQVRVTCRVVFVQWKYRARRGFVSIGVTGWMIRYGLCNLSVKEALMFFPNIFVCTAC
jgi:hypothetical protein